LTVLTLILNYTYHSSLGVFPTIQVSLKQISDAALVYSTKSQAKICHGHIHFKQNFDMDVTLYRTFNHWICKQHLGTEFIKETQKKINSKIGIKTVSPVTSLFGTVHGNSWWPYISITMWSLCLAKVVCNLNTFTNHPLECHTYSVKKNYFTYCQVVNSTEYSNLMYNNHRRQARRSRHGNYNYSITRGLHFWKVKVIGKVVSMLNKLPHHELN